MDLVAGIIERARADVVERKTRRPDERMCPILSPTIHPIEDCALPILREAIEFASLPKTDALEIALHLMGYIQNGI